MDVFTCAQAIRTGLETSAVAGIGIARLRSMSGVKRNRPADTLGEASSRQIAKDNGMVLWLQNGGDGKRIASAV
jgi:hypothetical protein